MLSSVQSSASKLELSVTVVRSSCSLLYSSSSVSLFKSMTTSVWVAAEKGAAYGGSTFPLRVVLAGSLVSVCILTCHSGKSVKKGSICKWQKGQQQLQKHARQV